MFPEHGFEFEEKNTHRELDNYLAKLPEEFMTHLDRKNSGTYYTPRDVTDYIAKHTIYPWILKQANKILLKRENTHVNIVQNIADFFTKASMETRITILEEYIGQITVCDNACGSGAFLIAAANVLYDVWDLAANKLGLEIEPAQIKDQIVTKNLYGVDLNSKAVDYARLRLKLWINDSKQPREDWTKLSITDNIRVGNSLFGHIFERDINKEEHRGDRIISHQDFHWFEAFPEIFKEQGSGFDIIIGNPPFGNPKKVKSNQNGVLNKYKVTGCGDICGYFLERELDLLKKDGNIGNILAGAVATNRSMTSVRTLMRTSGRFNLAYFGTRPFRLFPDNEERVVFVMGEKGPSVPIRTSTNHRFTNEQRASIFHDITYESTEGLCLGKKLGSCIGDRQTRLPKIGHKVKRHILMTLKEFTAKYRVFGDVLNSGKYTLEYRQSAGYFIHALHEFPYRSTKIKQLGFITEVQRDFGLLILNSSLYYLFWTAFGNNRDLPRSLITPFPFPEEKTLERKKLRIHRLAKIVNDNQLAVFDPNRGRVGEFKSSKCRFALDRVDRFLAKIYGLTEPELTYILNYDCHIRT
ncbi:MAG: Eco57I restriction-modification methylase domain-containing protein [Candidatus Heimdallarchaeota archaeon]